MKKVLTFGAAVTVALVSLAAGTARSEPELSVFPVNVDVSAGETFEMQIVVNADVSDLMGFNFTVWYDTLVLSIQAVGEGSLPDDSGYHTVFSWMNQGEKTNLISVSGAILGNTVDGPGVLCTLTFRAELLGVSGIHIVASDLRDGVNSSISHTVCSGVVFVDWTIPVVPVTWGVIKHGFR